MTVTDTIQKRESRSSESVLKHPVSKLDFILIAALITLCFVCFCNTIGGYFYADDFSFLRFASRIAGGELGLLWTLFSTPASEIQAYILCYRPLAIILFATEFSVFGTNPLGYHIVCVLLHSACTVLVYFLTRQLTINSQKIGNQRLISFFAGGLFASYPLHGEVVNWVTEQIDLFCALFILSSILLFLVSDSIAERPKIGAKTLRSLSLLCAGLSLLTKEHGVIVAPLLFAHCFIFRANGGIFSRLICSLKNSWPYFALLGAYFLLRYYTLGTPIGGYQPMTGDPFQLFSWKWTHHHGFWQIVFPLNRKLFPENHWLFWTYILTYAACLEVLITSMVQKIFFQSKDWKLMAFLGCWVAICFLPVIPTWMLEPDLAGSRHLYNMSAPALMLFTLLLISRVATTRKAVATQFSIFALLIIVFSFTTIANNKAFLVASNTMRELKESVSKALSDLAPGKNLVILQTPQRIAGVHLIYHWSLLNDMFRPPFQSQNLSSKLDVPSRHLFLSDDVVSASRLRDLIAHGDDFCRFNLEKGKLEPVTLRLGEPCLEGQLQFTSSQRISRKKVSFEFQPGDQDNLAKADFLEFRVDLTGAPVNRKPKATLEWQVAGDTKFGGTKLEALPVELSKQTLIYRFPVSESRSWLCAGEKAAVRVCISARAGGYQNPRLILISEANLVPKVSAVARVKPRAGVLTLNKTDKVTINYDVRGLENAHHSDLEVSRPGILLESLSPTLRLAHLSDSILETIRLDSSGAHIVDLSKLPKPAHYEFRISARSRENKLIGYYSDPINILINPACW